MLTKPVPQWGSPQSYLKEPKRGFRPTQTVVGGLAVVLSVGVALVWGEPFQRTAGPIALSLVLAATALLAMRTDGRRGQELVYATLSLAVLLVAELGWAVVDLSEPAVWLRCSVALVAALSLGTVGTSFGLARRLPAGGRWADAARQIGPVLGLIGAVALTAVVAQEGVLFDTVTKTSKKEPVLHLLLSPPTPITIPPCCFIGMYPLKPPVGRVPLYWVASPPD